MSNRIERIITKIERIEVLCAEVRAELQALKQETVTKARRTTKKEEIPSEAECKEEFNRLYELFLAGNAEAVEKFVMSKTKIYLKAFCKANDLPADTAKLAKKRIADEVLKWFAQRKAITQDSYATEE